MKFSASPFRQESITPQALVAGETLLKVSKQGRNVLAYIIEKQFPYPASEEYVILNRVDIINYFASRISTSYANDTNVQRGIKNLIDTNVLAESKDRNKYWINKNYLRK